MKIKHALSLASLAVCAALSTSAMAQSQVKFEGRVLDSICTGAVAGNGGTVTLTGVLTSALNGEGKVAGLTEFPVKLTGCDPAGANYQINFSHGSANTAGRLPNVADAGNVSLQLLSRNDSVLRFTSAVDTSRLPLSVDPGVGLAAGQTEGTATYKVQYYAEGVATAGKVNASATMTLTFL